MSSNYKKLQEVLTEIFQLDKADLDFGIYRIMNQKRSDIESFLTEKLPSQVKSILEKNNSGDTKALEAELEKTIKNLKELGADPDNSTKVIELKEKIKNGVSVDALEQEVFSHLASFFKRYYQGGDFISLRRYKKDVYAIPYEGEEVKLHWANHDQYYIKTSEYLKNYAFKTPDNKLVQFELKEASTEQNNNKSSKDKERRFALYTEEPVTINENELSINFTYEPYKKSVKQDKLNQDAIQELTSKIPSSFAQVFILKPTEKNKKRTLLEKHINDFTAKNTFDYFIHKDLGGFLRRELDFYIKNEILFIDDINTDKEIAFEAQLAKIKAFKEVATKIIVFLEQLENFQKKLWLKKKFIIKSDYCITLDRIPKDFYPQICENKAQLEEWIKLYDVKITKQEQLKDEPFLVVDTKFFDAEFKDNLLADFDNLDEQTDGLLINSDNFQALYKLKSKYKNQIKSIYIDPPYNTEGDGFLYKDQFKHSSWLSFMQDRLYFEKMLLGKESLSFYSIDEREVTNLKKLLAYLYPIENQAGEFVWNTKHSQQQGLVASYHEYVLLQSQVESKLLENFKAKGDDIIDAGALKKISKANPESEFTFPPGVRCEAKDDSIFENTWGGEEKVKIISGKFEVENKKTKYEMTLSAGWTQKNQMIKYFDKTIPEVYDTKGQLVKEFYFNSSGKLKCIKQKSKITPSSILDSFGTVSKSTKDLKDIMGNSDFGQPKPVSLVNYLLSLLLDKKQIALDYFAGSGTTGHAVIKLNRDDDGKRKYILVEMGEYFNTVTKPRMQKVIYTDNWKNGKPQDKDGISQMFKYMVLESYEDTLNNLALKQTNEQENLLSHDEALQEQYMLNYMLDVETREHLFNLDAFKNPFSYQLKITENNELIPTNVDLVETFNYLIGLHVKRMQKIQNIKLVEGKNNKGEKILVIWRDLDKTDNDALDRFVEKAGINVIDGEFDTIYVNGDNNLSNLKKEEENWKVLLTEEVFLNEMFDVKDV